MLLVVLLWLNHRNDSQKTLWIDICKSNILETTDLCVILKVKRSDTQSNVTLNVHGVDCNTVQDMPVICEKKKGIILCKIINFIYMSWN